MNMHTIAKLRSHYSTMSHQMNWMQSDCVGFVLRRKWHMDTDGTISTFDLIARELDVPIEIAHQIYYMHGSDMDQFDNLPIRAQRRIVASMFDTLVAHGTVNFNMNWPIRGEELAQ